MQLKNYLIIHNSAVENPQFEIWTRTEYEKYLSDTLGVGACPAVRIITDFNESDSLLRGIASIELEAETLYPYQIPEREIVLTFAEVTDYKRSAHITAARQYMGEIEKLRAENEKLRKALEDCCNDYNELQEQANRWKEESGR